MQRRKRSHDDGTRQGIAPPPCPFGAGIFLQRQGIASSKKWRGVVRFGTVVLSGRISGFSAATREAAIYSFWSVVR